MLDIVEGERSRSEDTSGEDGFGFGKVRKVLKTCFGLFLGVN